MTAPDTDGAVDGAAADGAALEASPLVRLLPRLLALFRHEPALAITAGYLLVAMAGLFYADRFYGKFDIPVLSLLQVSDFLMAGVQQPIALLLVLTTLPCIWVFDWLNSRMRRRFRRTLARLGDGDGLPWWQRSRRAFLRWRLGHQHDLFLQFMYLLILIGYGWMFVANYADYRAREVREGRAREVEVWMSDGQPLAASGGSHWRYLGAVSGYLFLYDGNSRQAQILPVEAVGRLHPLPRPRRSAWPLLVPLP